MENTRIKILKYMYDRGWSASEYEIKELGMVEHLEFLNMIEDGVVSRDSYNDEYMIAWEDRKAVLESLISAEQEK